jgi:hypothetical protein
MFSEEYGIELEKYFKFNWQNIKYSEFNSFSIYLACNTYFLTFNQLIESNFKNLKYLFE